MTMRLLLTAFYVKFGSSHPFSFGFFELECSRQIQAEKRGFNRRPIRTRIAQSADSHVATDPRKRIEKTNCHGANSRRVQPHTGTARLLLSYKSRQIPTGMGP